MPVRLPNGLTCASTVLAARAHARWLQRQAQHDQRLQVVPQHGVSLRVNRLVAETAGAFNHYVVTSTGGWLPFGNNSVRASRHIAVKFALYDTEHSIRRLGRRPCARSVLFCSVSQ